jgi:hypothetical protein
MDSMRRIRSAERAAVRDERDAESMVELQVE